jgi:cellulose synthase/poly-beta-1,6-N-acetylglucosamine synthase-like glycosyltransferase
MAPATTSTDNDESSYEVPLAARSGPVDLDDLFVDDDDDAASLFSSHEDDDDDFNQERRNEIATRYFANPNKRLLDNDASLIPGSPFSKPSVRASSRPNEPLTIAKYSSTAAFFLTAAWVASLLFVSIWGYGSIPRIIIEVVLSLLSFMGLFWNTYFIISSVCKCFIPRKAFLTNTKYCSIIPEPKPENTDWLDVTIQIPVYKESLLEVLMPTLKSCQAARDYYMSRSSARCNICVCDDGMMSFLKDNFAAAEMLWESVVSTQGRVIKLSKLLRQHVPRASRRHLKGLRSKAVYEVFHRMLYYYHYDIGFVARSTIDRRGKFKKASNLNAHLRLALGAAQLLHDDPDVLTFQDALLRESHNEDGARFVMFGNNVAAGDLICVNDADARMAPSVILKTVPEFLNDKALGFTQHATKTMNDQRGESYYCNMLAVYTDALYQGHFLLSSILGCHPPLVGHSIFLRTAAVQQCGRMRNLRSAQRWLRNIGLPFLPVDQVGFSNLSSANRIEYWSECHVSEDFELMIHLYNLGFNGRYCAYPDCEFQEGITRTFDEEAGRHRKFALGAHELVFNSFQDMVGQGIFTPLFRTFMQCDIPSYYKIFLTAYLCSYASGGAYLIVFSAAALTRLFDKEEEIGGTLFVFSPASIIILNFVFFYVIGYFTFLISLVRMHAINKNLLFAEYRSGNSCSGALYLIWVKLRYCLTFQFLFYNVATLTFYFLGSMDHMLSRPNICSATNKDSIHISRCEAFWEMAKFNSGSWLIAITIGGLAYATVLQDQSWDVTSFPPQSELIRHIFFAGPALFLAVMCFIVPIILNPHILGWPFLRKKPKQKSTNAGKEASRLPVRKDALGREIVSIRTFMDKAKNQLEDEIERKQGGPDVEIGSLCTKDLGSPTTTTRKSNSVDGPRFSVPTTGRPNGISLTSAQYKNAGNRMNSIPEVGSNVRAKNRPVASSKANNNRKAGGASKSYYVAEV